MARARLQLGTLLAANGSPVEAEEELENAYFGGRKDAAPEVEFDAALGLAHVVGVKLAREADGRRWTRMADVALEDVSDGEQLRRASLSVALANTLQRAGKNDEAQVALEQAVSAPFASRQLADLGARVIKIERPGEGDFARKYDTTVHGLASYFVWLNRSKESVTLDVKHPAGADLLGRLLARADVFIQNLAPGAAERLGLGWDALHARYPRLVACDISGYGSTGPAADRKAYDLLTHVGRISVGYYAFGTVACKVARQYLANPPRGDWPGA